MEKFTYEDWVNDNIPDPPSTPDILKGKISPYEYCYNWTDPPRMDFAEYEKIKEEQERVYKLAINIMVNSRTYYATNKVLPDLTKRKREDFIKVEMESMEERLTPELKKKVLQRSYSLKVITPVIREWILDFQEAYNEGLRLFFAWFMDPETGEEAFQHEYLTLDGLYAAHVDYGYLVELKKISELGLDKYLNHEKREAKKTSNSAELHIAEKWMNPLIREITDLNLPEKGDVIKLLNEYYPNFQEEFDCEKLGKPFIIGRRINKTAVSLAIAFIFKQKHGEIISTSAVKKRYEHPRFNYW